MAIVLKVDPADVVATAQDFNDKSQTLQNLTNNMVSLINGISGEAWTGMDASAYKAKFSGLQNDINSLTTLLRKEVSNLLTIAQNYMKAEQDNVTTASGLPSSFLG